MLTALIGAQNDVIRRVAWSVMESNRRVDAVIRKLDKVLRRNSAPTAVHEVLMQPVKVNLGVTVTVSNVQCVEAAIDTQISPAAASLPAQSASRKRPLTAIRSDDDAPEATSDIKQTRPSLNAKAIQVIGVFRNGEHATLRVWDGTKPSRSIARSQHAQPIAVDSELATSVNDCAVDIFCWDEHARTAKELKPHDQVSLVNVNAKVMPSGIETYTMHGGNNRFGRCIRRLQSPRLVAQLERQLSAVYHRVSPQSQDIFDATNR